MDEFYERKYADAETWRQTNGDTVALTYPSGINGLNTDVRFHWNGAGVELLGNPTGR